MGAQTTGNLSGLTEQSMAVTCGDTCQGIIAVIVADIVGWLIWR